ncbi:MAG: amino acid ABC transporter substrate-binding protein [Chloroflexi bacterium]|nr:amino acid ABC transporter substrate-binding protein [Chloroflexota bacterium]
MKRLIQRLPWWGWLGVGMMLLAGIGLWQIRARDDTWTRLQGGGALRVAMDPSFPPFEQVDADGQLQGFDVDLARLLAARLDVPLEFRAIAFDGLVDAVLADKADVVISAFPLDQRLTKDVHFSPPYFEAGLIWVTRKDSTLAGPEDFAGMQVAVEWGSQGDAWARERGLLILRQESAAAALQAVAAGKADVALVDAVTAALEAPANLTLHTPPLQSEPYVIVTSAKAPKFAAMVDEALLAMLEDGTWERLARRYFSQWPPPVSSP